MAAQLPHGSDEQVQLFQTYQQSAMQVAPVSAGGELLGSSVMGRPQLEPVQVCSFYMRTGTCAYGNRCKFYHPHPSDVPPPVLNSRGYPVRYNEPDCVHYRKKGWCAFGMTCKFNHPELLTSPANFAMTAGNPGNMLVTTNASNPTFVQGPVVYTTGSSGQTYQMVQAPQTVQQPTTVYYVPAHQGAFVPSVMQPYTVNSPLVATPAHESSVRSGTGGTSIMLTQAPGDSSSSVFTTSTTGGPQSTRAIYTTTQGVQAMYTGTQYVEPTIGPASMQQSQVPMMSRGPTQIGGLASTATLTGGKLQQGVSAAQQQAQQQQGVGTQKQLILGSGVGSELQSGLSYVTDISDQSSQQSGQPTGQQLPTSYIQQLPGLQQLQSGYLQAGTGVRQHMQLPGMRPQASGMGHVMLTEAGGDGGTYVVESAAALYEQAGGPGSSGSNLHSGSVQSGSFSGGLMGQNSGRPNSQSTLAAASGGGAQSQDHLLGGWQGHVGGSGGDRGSAGQDRLVQAMQTLRLNQQKQQLFLQQQQQKPPAS